MKVSAILRKMLALVFAVIVLLLSQASTGMVNNRPLSIRLSVAETKWNLAALLLIDRPVKSGVARTDANDMLYYFDSSREYNPSPIHCHAYLHW